jgi:hypothetical protein
MPYDLEKKYPGLRDKILKAYDAGYTDSMIEANVRQKIKQAKDAGYSDDIIRQNLGVSKDFKLPVVDPSSWRKVLEVLTGGHIPAPSPPPPPEVEHTKTGEIKINIPETAKVGFFEDPITAVAFGAVAGARAAVPLGKKVLTAAKEAISWATGGLTDVPKLASKGTEKVVEGVAAKRLEETMSGAFKTAEKGLGVKAEKAADYIASTTVKPGAKVMELIKTRRANIDKGILDSEIFIRDIERRLTKKELEAVPFIRQGIKDIDVLKKIGREDLIPIIKNPSRELIKATGDIAKYYDEAHEFLKKTWGEDIGFVKNYVTQLWDIPKGKKDEIINYFATRNPFLKKRKIPTFEEGIKLGLKPRTTNIAELLRIYDQYKIKTVHNFKFADELKNMVDDKGNRLILPEKKAPATWVKIDHPAMRRLQFSGKTKKGTTILTDRPVKVNPEIAKEVKIIFDEPINNEWIRAYETVNAFLKKSMLTLSLFHHHALTESAFSAGIGRKALKLWNLFKVPRALRNKNYDIFKEIDLAKDAIDHSVTFGALEDVQRGRVVKALKDIENKTKNIPGIKQFTKGIRKANELWDAALWDYLHNGLKLYAYEHNVAKALKHAEKIAQKKYNRSLLPNEIEKIKDTTGLFINDSFGGQNWELNKILGNPKTRQMLHWVFLAPDWTFSVLKQAAAPAKGLALQVTAKGDIAQKLAGKALTKRGALFWARAATYFNIIAQAINYQNTKKEYGEGRFTWENPPGNKFNIFIGRNEDKTERYVRMGKQFREVLEWGEDPLKKAGAKLSPLLREIFRQATAHDPGSGYPTEWAKETGFWKTLPERAKSIAEMPLPFSLRPYVESRPGVYMFTFPTKKGMTNYGAIKLFKEALKDRDKSKVVKTYIHAVENKLNAFQLLKSAKASVKADITYDDKMLAKDILKELKNLDPLARKEAFNLYMQRGTITPNVLMQLNKLLRSEEEIRKQQAILNPKKD